MTIRITNLYEYTNTQLRFCLICRFVSIRYSYCNSDSPKKPETSPNDNYEEEGLTIVGTLGMSPVCMSRVISNELSRRLTKPQIESMKNTPMMPQIINCLASTRFS